MKPEYQILLETFGMYVVSILVMFLIIRSLNLWYWRINDIVKNQEEQTRLLKKMAGEEIDQEPDRENT